MTCKALRSRLDRRYIRIIIIIIIIIIKCQLLRALVDRRSMAVEL